MREREGWIRRAGLTKGVLLYFINKNYYSPDQLSAGFPEYQNCRTGVPRGNLIEGGKGREGEGTPWMGRLQQYTFCKD